MQLQSPLHFGKVIAHKVELATGAHTEIQLEINSDRRSKKNSAFYTLHQWSNWGGKSKGERPGTHLTFSISGKAHKGKLLLKDLISLLKKAEPGKDVTQKELDDARNHYLFQADRYFKEKEGALNLQA